MSTYMLRRRYFPCATFGEWFNEQGTRLCVTVERPWQNNRPNVSCIPEGEYTLHAHTSPSKGACLSIEAPTLGVTLTGPSLRTACLVHVANRAVELQGCIAPGERFGVIGGDWAVLNSRNALDALIAQVGTGTSLLRIVRD